MGGGGKGGKTTQEMKLPPELEAGAKGVLAGALRSAALGYRPNRGVTVAAFSPQQMAAFEGANAAAAAFGLPNAGGSPTGGYLPTPETTAGGIQGYSTGGILDESIAKSMTDQDIAARESILKSYAGIADEVSGTTPKALADNKYYMTGQAIMDAKNNFPAAKQSLSNKVAGKGSVPQSGGK